MLPGSIDGDPDHHSAGNATVTVLARRIGTIVGINPGVLGQTRQNHLTRSRP